jgi:hypothetical protein
LVEAARSTRAEKVKYNRLSIETILFLYSLWSIEMERVMLKSITLGQVLQSALFAWSAGFSCLTLWLSIATIIHGSAFAMSTMGLLWLGVLGSGVAIWLSMLSYSVRNHARRQTQNAPRHLAIGSGVSGAV